MREAGGGEMSGGLTDDRKPERPLGWRADGGTVRDRPCGGPARVVLHGALAVISPQVDTKASPLSRPLPYPARYPLRKLTIIPPFASTSCAGSPREDAWRLSQEGHGYFLGVVPCEHRRGPG